MAGAVGQVAVLASLSATISPCEATSAVAAVVEVSVVVVGYLIVAAAVAVVVVGYLVVAAARFAVVVAVVVAATS
jgi:hypothetical protein